jgi:hypothetical protein
MGYFVTFLNGQRSIQLDGKGNPIERGLMARNSRPIKRRWASTIIHKGSLGSLGRGEQSFPEGRSKGKQGPRGRRRDDGKTGRRVEWPVHRTCRLAYRPGRRRRRQARPRAKPNKQPPRKIEDKLARQAALGYERAERQRESERRKEEAAKAKERQRREQAINKAQAALEKAEREHDTRASAIEAERAAWKALASRGRPLGEAETEAGPRSAPGAGIGRSERARG